jgi:hypothetical protein
MPWIMHDKGYGFPLYSLDLIAEEAAPADEPRYFYRVPEGRLVVRPALRRRAGDVPTGRVDDAVAVALSRHGLHPHAFARHGFTEAWARGMAHWRRLMIDQQRLRHTRQAELDLANEARRELMRRAQRMWGRLSLASRLAGLPGMVLRGRAPQAGAALCAALEQAAARAREHEAPLARHGFAAEEQAGLASLLSALRTSLSSGREPAWKKEEAACGLVVLRAALLGDVSLFVQAAPEVLLPAHLPALRMQRLLGAAG